MSTPDGEPLLPADYGTPEMTRERLIAWDVPAIAADTEAMRAAAKEYALRLLFEHGAFGWVKPYAQLWKKAGQAAMTEYLNAKIIKEGTTR